MKTKNKCPQCGKEHIKKDGQRKTGNRGLIQRYKCKDCLHRFVLDDGFYRMRNSPQKITLCLDLFYRGISTRKVQEHLQAFYPHNSDHSTILRWLWKYARGISRFTDSLKLKVGTEAQADEVEFKRRKSHIKGSSGTEQNWLIDSIDPTTKFILSSEYMPSREAESVKVVIDRIKERAGEQIKTVTTDGWQAYGKIIKKVWKWNNKLQRYNVFHNKVVVSEEEGNFNYPIERLHNSIRARTKTMRGFHGSVESANLILKGLEVYYNFITKHQSIGCCPYELAVPELKGKLGVNKWLDLIRLSNNLQIGL